MSSSSQDPTSAGKLVALLKQDAESLEKSSFVCTFFMVRQKEEWERGASINYNTKEFLTDKWHYTTTDTLGHRNLIKNMIAGASESSTLLRMKQTYNDVNKMDCDTAGHEQEWCEATSNEMKNIPIKVEPRRGFIETNTSKILL